MKILAIDTATEACSVALQTDNSVVKRFEICPQKQSQRLLPMLDEVMKDASMTLSDLDLLAFGRGPGSFTGVRIATGMIQGLALGTGLRVAGVSTLAAMAQQAVDNKGAKMIACATDARMGEVYFAVYEHIDGQLIERVSEQVCAPDVAAKQVAALGENIEAVGTGWNAYPQLGALILHNTAVTIEYPDASAMLPLAEQLARQGHVDTAASITPVYLRDTVTWKKLPGRE